MTDKENLSDSLANNTTAPVVPDQTDVLDRKDIPDIAVARPVDAATQPSSSTGPTTPSTTTLQPADAKLGKAGDNEDQRLDEALQETMTTSDPVSIKIA